MGSHKLQGERQTGDSAAEDHDVVRSRDDPVQALTNRQSTQ